MRKILTKQFKKEKEFIKLINERSLNTKHQKDLGWIELDTPIRKGWIVSLSLREDIKNREDSWILKGIIDLYGSSTFIKRKSDFSFKKDEYELPNNIKPDKKLNTNKPSIKNIRDDEYLCLLPQVQKWFVLDKTTYSWYYGWRNTYKCVIPDFFFDFEFEKYYKTHIKVIDEILKQEESEIDFFLIKDHYYMEYGKYNTAPKAYRKFLNKRERARSKQTLFNLLKGIEDEFSDCYKGASWYW